MSTKADSAAHENLRESRMRVGENNSSSYVEGLLRSVMGLDGILPLNVILWGASIPFMNYSVMALSAHGVAKVPDVVLPVFILMLILWAGLIYWRLIPAFQKPYQKVISLLLFAGLMFLVSLAGLWVAFVVAASTFGI